MRPKQRGRPRSGRSRWQTGAQGAPVPKLLLGSPSDMTVCSVWGLVRAGACLPAVCQAVRECVCVGVCCVCVCVGVCVCRLWGLRARQVQEQGCEGRIGPGTAVRLWTDPLLGGPLRPQPCPSKLGSGSRPSQESVQSTGVSLHRCLQAQGLSLPFPLRVCIRVSLRSTQP